jgi:hypothetical protein
MIAVLQYAGDYFPSITVKHIIRNFGSYFMVQNRFLNLGRLRSKFVALRFLFLSKSLLTFSFSKYLPSFVFILGLAIHIKIQFTFAFPKKHQNILSNNIFLRQFNYLSFLATFLMTSYDLISLCLANILICSIHLLCLQPFL